MYFLLRRIFLRVDLARDTVRVSKGLLLRRQFCIPFSAVTKVEVRRTPVLRLLRGKRVEISTLSGGVSFYKSANLKPSVVFRPYEPPAQTPSDEYPFYFVTGRLLEHWHTGTMTRRVPELDRALPEALLNMNPDDCKKLGIQDGDMVKVKSTYGEFDIKVSTAGRTEPPAGVTFAPFFAEETLVNLAVQDVYCPLSKEPDYKKTCVSITKL